MEEKNQLDIENKILELLDKSKPKPDIIESLEILRSIEKAFLEELKEKLNCQS